ncbi:MAG: hypothetical protein H7A04_18060 [Pseudomonadales bacterium]|nr:hypothetical protein [Pseudomonadales bacterium]
MAAHSARVAAPVQAPGGHLSKLPDRHPSGVQDRCRRIGGRTDSEDSVRIVQDLVSIGKTPVRA